MKKVTAEKLWRTLRLFWIEFFLGTPDITSHDAGKNFVVKAFQSNADIIHAKRKKIPVEASHSMIIVERYYEPIRNAYRIIRNEARNIDKELTLQSSIKSIKDSVGPDGLVPTLLVYGALPRLGMSTDPPNLSNYHLAAAVHKATQAMSKYVNSVNERDLVLLARGHCRFGIDAFLPRRTAGV